MLGKISLHYPINNNNAMQAVKGKVQIAIYVQRILRRGIGSPH